MAYFRFRRSIKILPGVRWNIGKKSSSISIGRRGTHYTIGPSGSRTTIGLPGTGLSYTSVSRRKTLENLSDADIAKAAAEAVERVGKREETFNLNIPALLPDEAPATPEQLETIRGMIRSITGPDMTKLGEKQAAFLIDQITRERHEFTERNMHEALDRITGQKSGTGCLLLILVAIGIGCDLLHFR